MESTLYLKLKTGEQYKVDNFTDLNVFLEVIDEFIKFNHMTDNYMNDFFKLSVDDGNALAFNVLEIRTVYQKNSIESN
ncbi:MULTISPECIES: hypothetical protein [unclassified Exiguobacterium]|uniref:hypothetical protein n=1 Tax=unclassified Exiguobacterium TaxID=2644629 RepID=UPI001BEA0C9C|nr:MULTISPECIES: hypothetical protein [unclassified Exiguobacterium]